MPLEILMPALSPTMEDGTLAKWLVKEGDKIVSGDVIAEIETDKATMEFEAVDEGTIARILVPAGSAGVAVNTAIALLLEEGDEDNVIPEKPMAMASEIASVARPKFAPVGASPLEQPNETARVFASPLARRLAERKGLDLGQITGSGPRGRIVKADVDAALAPPLSSTQNAAPKTPRTIELGADTVLKTYADRPHKEVALDSMRRTIAARLTHAKQTVPHFYLRRDIRLDDLLDVRAQINAQLATRGAKLSVNDFIIKACAQALQQVPAANVIWAGDRILQLSPSDVAVAVAVEGGLLTPVLRDAEQKTLSTLSTEMKDLATRARGRKLAPHQYQGGSFAISNLGMFGVENFDAIINPPQSAILAVGAGVKKPVVSKTGDLTIATVMSVTLSIDHRAIDGALGAELLQSIVNGLENPFALLV